MLIIKRALTASILFYFLSLSSGFCQLTLNASYGIQIPGKQDLKFRYYDHGNLIKNLETSDVASSVSPISNLSVTYWRKSIGFDLSYLCWENTSTGIKFKTEERPPFTKIEAARKFLVLSILLRTRFPFSKGKTVKDGNYGYWGAGIGSEMTDETPVLKEDHRLGFQLICGVKVKVASRISLFSDVRYLLTQDVDSYPPATFTGWRVDTSGNPFLLRTGPHYDTRFYAFLFGITYRLC